MTGGYTISAGPVLLVAFALAAVLGVRSVRRGDRRSKTALIVAAAVYSGWVLALTVFPLWIGELAFDMSADPLWRDSVNLVPLKTIRLYLTAESLDARVKLVNLLGNLALLAPMGFAAPALSRRLDGWWRIALLGLGSATAIEAMQFARRYVFGMVGRSIDIDDVILNAVGALIGYGLLLLVRPVWRRIRPRRQDVPRA